MNGTIDRRELDDLVNSYYIWNAWQDDDAEIVALRDLVGELELLLCEVGEGMRNESELKAKARDLVGAATAPPRKRVVRT